MGSESTRNRRRIARFDRIRQAATHHNPSEVFDLKPTRVQSRSFTGVLGVLATWREILLPVH